MQNPRKAYVLTSGGLDSTLAVKMLQEQGINVTGVYISTGFCLNSHQKKSGRFDDSKPDVFKVTEELGIDLEVIDISKEYLSIITHPVYGWGKNINPCIDCRIYMLQKTRELMEKNGFDFIATGEVLGQRPMSQRSDTSRLIEEKSGLKGFLLRPLSGQLHKETEPEKRGWVARNKLGRIQGRSRKEQFKLAKYYNLQNISSPAGGCCLLTDETCAVRFKDHLGDRFRMLKSDSSQPLTMDNLMILGTGRQIKIRSGLKLVMGRNEGENKLLAHYSPDHIVLEPEENWPGPTALLPFVFNETRLNTQEEIQKIWKFKINGDEYIEDYDKIKNFLSQCGSDYENHLNPEDILVASMILARYIDSTGKEKTSVRVSLPKKENGVIRAKTEIWLNVPPINLEEILSRQLVIKSNEKYFTVNKD